MQPVTLVNRLFTNYLNNIMTHTAEAFATLCFDVAFAMSADVATP